MRIGHRIVLTFCLLVMLVIGTGGLGLYRLVLGHFEQQMAQHLVSVSFLVAESLDGDVVGQIQPRYGVYGRLHVHLEGLQARVGAARIVVFGREGKRLLDTQVPDAFGQPYVRLAFDKEEISQVWTGKPAHSVAFYNASGEAFQTGYAPLFRGETVVAVVAVDLGVGFVAAIETFRQSLIVLGGIGVLLTVVVGFALSKTLTRPIAQLAKSAQVIGQGKLDTPVVASSQDELGALAETLNKMRLELAARDEQLRQMLGGVAHEIRNPLGGIELYAGFIADDLEDSDPRRDHILKVISEVRKLNQVISDFLMFARPALLQTEPLDLKEVVSDALFLLAPEMAQVQIVTQVNLDGDGAVLADAIQVKGAVVNVIKNAIQAMPNGGTLAIWFDQDLEDVVLAVKDTGKGISAEDQQHILEPFFTTKEKGSGLGLAIVKQVMEKHGGQLHIESRVGVGTEVRLIFERMV